MVQLCGTGVSSFIAVISKPAVCKARIAFSLPLPKPLTNTSTFFTPEAVAAPAAASAACPAANGVFFLEPLYPIVPADAQLITFPSLSVIETTVLF